MARAKNQGITITILSNKNIEVQSPYVPELIAAYKTIPKQDRAWDTVRKVWTFKAHRHGEVRDLLSELLPDMKIQVYQIADSVLGRQQELINNLIREAKQGIKPSAEKIPL